MLLFDESQYSRLFGFDCSLHSVQSIRSAVDPPNRVAPCGSRALKETSYPLYHSFWLSSGATTLLMRVKAAGLTLYIGMMLPSIGLPTFTMGESMNLADC